MFARKSIATHFHAPLSFAITMPRSKVKSI